MKTILTGDNTTGRLHLGHYVGSHENRVKLQDEYKTFIILADIHSFAYPKYLSDPQTVSDSVLAVLADNLAVGLDPKKATFFQESAVPAIFELATIFSMLVTHSRALRNPTIKDEIRDKNLGDNFSLGFAFFPILQAADILCVNADLVPVGEDQLAHIEQTNEVVRKFNLLYGKTFKEVQGLVGRVKRLIGTDGNAKMTKSLNNAIFLSDGEEELKTKVMSMYTDPKRLHATDPGTVEGNPVFIYHDAFNPNKAEVDDLKERYHAGKVGDVEVKQKLFLALNTFLTPIREKRRYYESRMDEVLEILHSGNQAVRQEAQVTLDKVLYALKLKK
ncbi:tryptophan--tRNA ligase [candidate division WWE3 bacterium CG08_land_8_20_14_0_20_41_10]|uniref:Tryptophan--tRNA ligase n=1 Tax=candidate division WWE3 bacterium CG08_land_8_20_14_0_20_41_10 TaxID=1975085 RepID=A0A2H0XCC7_UNCKA|nr:MAG: tryptophan--tRNA ligase [candidate division WWE3 bacterium CG08_land_8_20_14_0_20_41_10]